MGDTATKSVLGTFVSTFLYCLLTLRILGSIDATSPVPFVNVALALVFTMFSVGALGFFIHHVSQSVQVDIIVKSLSEELLEAIEKLFASKIGDRSGEKQAAAGWAPKPVPTDIVAELGRCIHSFTGKGAYQ